MKRSTSMALHLIGAAGWLGEGTGDPWGCGGRFFACFGDARSSEICMSSFLVMTDDCILGRGDKPIFWAQCLSRNKPKSESHLI